MYPQPCRMPVTKGIEKFGNASHIIILFGTWYMETKHFTFDVAKKFYKTYKNKYNNYSYLKKIGKATIFDVESSDGERTYKVVHNGGNWRNMKNFTCSCKGWKWRKKCRHIEEVQDREVQL